MEGEDSSREADAAGRSLVDNGPSLASAEATAAGDDGEDAPTPAHSQKQQQGLAAATGWGLGFWLPLSVLVVVTVAMAATTMVGVWVGVSQMVITGMLAGGGLLVAAMCCLLCYQCYKRSISEIMPKGQQSVAMTNSEHEPHASSSRHREPASRRGSHVNAESPLLHRSSSAHERDHAPNGASAANHEYLTVVETRH